MTHQNNDNCAVPEGIRKGTSIHDVGNLRGGGKAIAGNEHVQQMNLFDGIAETDQDVSTGTPERCKRISLSLPGLPKPLYKSHHDAQATIEGVIVHLDAAERAVKSNKGSPGPDRQTVETVHEHWHEIKPKLITHLLAGTYIPGDIRRKWIPKPGGGDRGLGIPNVIDRIVQTAIKQVIEPLFEPHFHNSSHGFRPGRSCHTAIKQAHQYVSEGYDVVVDIDLKDYFNQVNHQRLMAKLAQRMSDKPLLRVIGLMLKAKVVMPDGVVVDTDEGVPQGGALSPLLSNIYLDELDRELCRRGHKFVRYADDCNIYVRSEKAGHRVMTSIRKFIEGKMRLEINEKKSAVARPEDRHFVGFRLCTVDDNVEIVLSQRSVERLNRRVVELIPRNYGGSINSCIERVNAYLTGWIGFFGICTSSVQRSLRTVDAHIRRRLRALQLKQWKRKRTIVRKLVSMGAKRKTAFKTVYGRKRGIWNLSVTFLVNRTLSNQYWFDKGLRTLAGLWEGRQIREVAPVQLMLDLV